MNPARGLPGQVFSVLRRKGGPFLRDLLLCLLGPMLYSAAFPPFTFPQAVWFALVPSLFLAGSGGRGRYTVLAVSGVLFSLYFYRWLSVFHPLALPFFIVYGGLAGFFFPLAVFAFVSRRSRLGAFLLFPAVWVLMEYLRTEHLLRFGFGSLYLSQYRTPVMIQIADLAGAYGISWLIAAVNAAVWLLCMSAGAVYRNRDSKPAAEVMRNMAAAAAAVLLVAGASAYGKVRLESPLVPLQTSVGLAQYDHRSARMNPDGELGFLDEYEALAGTAGGTEPDLVVFPESSIQHFLSLDPVRQPAGSTDILNRLSSIARTSGRLVLFGVLELEFSGNRQNLYNSTLLFDTNGDLSGRYRKRVLAPFGESDPFSGAFPGLEEFVLSRTNAIRLTPGDSAPVQKYVARTGAERRFGMLICYEATSGNLVRGYSKSGADFLVNITSDRWTGSAGAMEQHAAFSVFRAVENRLPLVRVGNGGRSFLVDPLGRVERELPLFSRAFGTVEPLKLREWKGTLYSRTGDLPVLGGACLLIVLSILCLVRRRTSA